MKRFEAHDWPGNVRELQNVLESSLIAADQGMITLECLPDYLQQNARPVRPAVQGNLREIEKYMIMETLQRNDHNISQAARELGITRTTLYKKMEQMGLKRTV